MAPKSPFHYYKDFEPERPWLNEFGKHLRNQADYDYIASRALFRRGSYMHAAYLAHQSVEKYFKSILLFVKQGTRKYGHDIEKLMKVNLNFGLLLNSDSVALVDMLSGLHNVSRYRSGNYCLDLAFINYLDYFVLDIRPFVQSRCVNVNQVLNSNYLMIQSGHSRKNQPYIHSSGVLEKVLKGNNPREKLNKEDLVWNNQYFGGVSSQQVVRFKGSQGANLPFNFAAESDLSRARYVMDFFKFEPEIEALIKPKPSAGAL